VPKETDAVSAAEAAGLAAAALWLVLVAATAVVLVRLTRLLRDARRRFAGIAERATPLLDQAADDLEDARRQLGRVDAVTAELHEIAAQVQQVTSSASALSATVNSTVAGPLVKAAALGHGVRRAFGSGRKPPQPPNPRRSRG
jgi:methyl-accepting chemotaxis protein